MKYLKPAIIIVIIFLFFGIIYFFEFGKKNLVEDFIVEPNDFKNKIERITIWEETETTNNSLIIVNKEDELYDEIQTVLNGWEIKRDFFNDIDLLHTSYKISLSNEERPNEPLNILIDQKGMLYIKGKTYKLVTGNLNELLAPIKSD